MSEIIDLQNLTSETKETDGYIEQLQISAKVVDLSQPQKIAKDLDQVVVAIKVWIDYAFDKQNKLRVTEDYLNFPNKKEADAFIEATIPEAKMNMKAYQAKYMETMSEEDRKAYKSFLDELQALQDNGQEHVAKRMEEVMQAEKEVENIQEERVEAFQEGAKQDN